MVAARPQQYGRQLAGELLALNGAAHLLRVNEAVVIAARRAPPPSAAHSCHAPPSAPPPAHGNFSEVADGSTRSRSLSIARSASGARGDAHTPSGSGTSRASSAALQFAAAEMLCFS